MTKDILVKDEGGILILCKVLIEFSGHEVLAFLSWTKMQVADIQTKTEISVFSCKVNQISC